MITRPLKGLFFFTKTNVDKRFLRVFYLGAQRRPKRSNPDGTPKKVGNDLSRLYTYDARAAMEILWNPCFPDFSALFLANP
jgi:hypothetical protein